MCWVTRRPAWLNNFVTPYKLLSSPSPPPRSQSRAVNSHPLSLPNPLPPSDSAGISPAHLFIRDSTVCNSFAPSHILDTVVNGRIATSIAERKKTQEYQDLTGNYLFQPIVLETFGGTGPLTIKFLSTLIACLTKTSGGAHGGLPNALALPSCKVMLQVFWLTAVGSV